MIIQNKEVAVGKPALIIAEVGQAHDGSLGTAHAFIDAIADAGADAVKFQTHIAEAESTEKEQWRVKFSYQDLTRYDYWKRMEFTKEQWLGLKKHADDKGLIFLSSPFSIEAVHLLQDIGMEAWKIASGEIANPLLLNEILNTKKPMLLSSGMSNMHELDQVIGRIKSNHCPFAVFQCTTSYPSPPEKIGLNMLAKLRDRYNCPVGLSDHSGTIFPSLAAASLGVEVIEVHVTLSREMFGPDVSSSVTTTELKQLVEGVRYIETIRMNPVDKDKIFEEVKHLRNLFTRSIVLNERIKQGDRLEHRHITLKKPFIGLSGEDIENVIGKKVKKDLQQGHFLQWEDMEDENGN